MQAHPDPKEIRRAARFFKVLSHPGRLEIACRLAQSDATQTQLVAALGLPQSSVARLLLPLRELELVEGERQGQEVRLSVSDPVVTQLMGTVCDWLHGETRDGDAAGEA